MNEQKELQYRKMLREARTQAYLPAILSAVRPFVCALLFGALAAFLNSGAGFLGVFAEQNAADRKEYLEKRDELTSQIDQAKRQIKESESLIADLEKKAARAEETFQTADKRYKDAWDNYQKVAREESQQRGVNVSRIEEFSPKAREARAESDSAKEELEKLRKEDKAVFLKAQLSSEKENLSQVKLECEAKEKILKELKKSDSIPWFAIAQRFLEIFSGCSALMALVLMILSVKRLASADKRLLEIVDRQEAALNATVKSVDAPPVQ